MKTMLTAMLLALSLTTFAQPAKFTTYYYQRATLFEKLPDTRNEIVFLGNSITDGSEWIELLQNRRIKNRGISGDTTEGVLNRLETITKTKPAAIFLLIGINDLSRNVLPDTIFANIVKITQQIQTESPRTKVFVQSILPVNNTFTTFKSATSKTGEVKQVNSQLEARFKNSSVIYIDLFGRFKNPGDDLLNPEYTNDGLHIMGAGYQLWAEIIRPYL